MIQTCESVIWLRQWHAAVEVPDEDMNGSRHLADFDPPASPVLDGARAVNTSTQPSEDERRKHNVTRLASCSTVYHLFAAQARLMIHVAVFTCRTHTHIHNATPQMTCFRDAKVCTKWLQGKVMRHSWERITFICEHDRSHTQTNVRHIYKIGV